MRFLIFKEKYEFKLGDTVITVDPVDTIRRGVKSTTFRRNKKPLGPYGIRQGNYFHPIVPKDFYLRIYKREPRTIQSLTVEEIRVDLGLTAHEMSQVYYPSLFLDGIRKINRNKRIQPTDIFYLYYFRVIWRTNNQKLDKFFIKEVKKAA